MQYYKPIGETIIPSTLQTKNLQPLNYVIHNQVDIPMQPSIFILNSLNTRGNTSKFIQLQSQINCYVQSFFPEASKLWNLLTKSIVSCSEIKKFKQSIFIIITELTNYDRYTKRVMISML